MSTMVGNWRMAITDGCMPGDRLSLLNLGSVNAHVELTFCAPGGPPLGPVRLVVPPRRTLCPVLDDLLDAGAPVPGPPYSVVVMADAPVLVQPLPAGREAAEERRPAA
ncbi:sensory rhodopsin transducer [Nonomuraea sp. NPDC004297]